MSKEQVLQEVYGYTAFRPGQAEIIDAILAGRDVLAILPTGGGKSLCFVLPALLLPGTTLVISPLIALMEDQVRHLQQRGIAAACLHGAMKRKAQKEVFDTLANGKLQLLYVSPERLSDPRFCARIRSVPVPLLAVDEAHCISQWGHDFRPPYRKIARFLHLSSTMQTRPVVAAFTASATSAVRQDICQVLELSNPFLYRASFDRPKLFFSLRQTLPLSAGDAGGDAFSQLLHFLRAHRGQCGVIYCRLRRRSVFLSRQLAKVGIPAVCYHAGMPAKERAAAADRWLSGAVPVIVATNAFGMGVDKADVRFVVHYGLPPDLESYYQEAGRAGRDGRAADCLLLTHPADLRLFRLFRKELTAAPQRAAYDARLRSMLRYAGGSRCLRAQLLDYFDDDTKKDHPSAFTQHSADGTRKVLSAKTDHFCCSVCAGDTQPYALAAPGVIDHALYAELRAFRRQLSTERGIPAEKIARNPLLQDLATARPKRLWHLLLTGSCPLRFFILYARCFLDVIRLFCALHGDLPRNRKLC